MGCSTQKVLSNLMPSVIRISLVALMINALEKKKVKLNFAWVEFQFKI